MVKRLFEDLPGSMLIGIPQRGSPGAFCKPQMVQFARTTSQSAANLPQRLGIAEVAEQHADQLIPACEPFSAAVSGMATDDATKRLAISEVMI